MEGNHETGQEQVEYFKKRRVMEYSRDQMLKGLRAEGARQVDLPDPVGRAQVDEK